MCWSSFVVCWLMVVVRCVFVVFGSLFAASSLMLFGV